MASATAALPVRLAGGVQKTDENVLFAQQIQLAADRAVQSIQGKSDLQGVAWSKPLAAAPMAVSAMAILFKTASSKVAAGLPVASPDITDGNGKVLGQLKFGKLHSNLEACSDVGASAFKDARIIMGKISHVATRMTEDNGQIAYIVKLLSKPAGEQQSLISEMNDVKTSAEQCLAEIKGLTEKFHYWHAFIDCLKYNVIECRGKTQDKTNEVENDEAATAKEARQYEQEEKAAAETVEKLKSQLAEAEKAVQDAQKHVVALANLKPIVEPSLADERRRAEKEIVATEKKQGLIKSAKTKLFGESDAQVAEREARELELERRREEFIDKEKARRELDRQHAADELNKARKFEVSLREAITKATQALDESEMRRIDADANLIRTKDQLHRLSEGKMELTEILKMLKASGAQLNKLKKEVDKLVHFFDTILQEISLTVEKDLKDMFRPIEDGTRTYYNTNVVSSVEMSSDRIERVIVKAMQISGGFSTVKEITSAYVVVSDLYIKPAIEKMDDLKYVEDEEWLEESGKFSEWCKASVQQIETLAKAAGAKANVNMQERIEYLQCMAIAAFEK